MIPTTDESHNVGTLGPGVPTLCVTHLREVGGSTIALSLVV